MGNFSKPPSAVLADNQDKGYVGLWIEQGVPILDRDLNLMQDLIVAAVRSLAAHYIGDGIAAGTNGFAIGAIPDGQHIHDFGISPGSCLVNGIEVLNRARSTYGEQPNVPPLTMYGGDENFLRIDAIYLDVFPLEVDGTLDAVLVNRQDVGMQTSTRLKAAWVVRVAEGVRLRRIDDESEIDGVPFPATPPGHTFYRLAEFWTYSGEVGSIDADRITDLRQCHLTLADIERRVCLLETAAPTFAPQEWQFRPISGPSGSPVRLSGRNFDQDNAKVYFEDSAADISFITATEIELKVPDVGGILPRTMKISVFTDSGQVTSDDDFTVTRL